MKYFTSISNILYLGSAWVQLNAYNFWVGFALIVLALSSGVYHYKLARVRAKLPERDSSLIFWQHMDVSSIYLVLGLFPYEVSGDPMWLVCLPVAIALIAHRFVTWERNKQLPSVWVVLGFSAVIFPIAMVYNPIDHWLTAMALFAFAYVFNHIAEQFKFSHPWAYEIHGIWHVISAFGFMLIT